MAKAYSQDLRDRVIDAVTGAGMKCREAGRRFGVGASTAIKWVERYRETGSRRPVGTGGHRPSVLKPHRDFLVAVRAEHGVRRARKISVKRYRRYGRCRRALRLYGLLHPYPAGGLGKVPASSAGRGGEAVGRWWRPSCRRRWKRR